MSQLITLGRRVAGGQPVELPRSLFGHMHIRGMTGAGKTSLALIPLIEQFVAPYRDAGKLTGPERRDPLFVFDLGGDQNLFHRTKEAAAKAGRKFRFLVLDPDHESYFFPPLQAVPGGESNVVRVAQMLVQAFHMDYGLIYGGSYFTQQNVGALLRVARNQRQATAPTLADIARYLDDPANRRQFKDADEVRMTFDFLLEYPQLASADDPEREINLAEALEQGDVVYFFTPTLTEPMTARLVAGLGLYSVMHAAIERTRTGKEPRAIRIFIDEFQEIVGRSLAALLAQSRKFGLSLFLANQSTRQLENRDSSLADVVFEGTAVKQYFTCVGKEDTEVLQGLSKDKIKVLGGASQHGLSASTSTREMIAPTLDADEILNVTYAFGHSFVVVNDGHGHQEPIRVEQKHQGDNLGQVPLARWERFAGGSARQSAQDAAEKAARQDALEKLDQALEAEEGGDAP